MLEGRNHPRLCLISNCNFVITESSVHNVSSLVLDKKLEGNRWWNVKQNTCILDK